VLFQGRENTLKPRVLLAEGSFSLIS